jgi:hypothetical protein
MITRASISLQSWNAARRARKEERAVKCGSCGHAEPASVWRRLRHRPQGVRMQGGWYCGAECLEGALAEFLCRSRPAARHHAIPSHRIPLGLLLLSRQQLTAEQLRAGLDAQRAAHRGKIGEWLQELGFVTEPQVTAGLARQWSCPVLRTAPGELGAIRHLPIPALLLESFQMIPVELVEATGTLLMAFSEGIDYTVLYAVEQMLDCHTEACLVSPSTLRRGLQALAQRRGTGDVVFDHTEDAGECARIIGNYATRIEAEQIRLATCGEHIWVRLQKLRSETVNLVVRTRRDASPGLPAYSAAAGASADLHPLAKVSAVAADNFYGKQPRPA